MNDATIKSVSYKSIRKTESGRTFLDPSICVFIYDNVEEQEFFDVEIVDVAIEEKDEGIVELISLALDSEVDEPEYIFDLPVSYVSLLLAFSLNPNPLNLSFFSASLEEQEVLEEKDRVFQAFMPQNTDSILSMAETIIPISDPIKTFPMTSNIKKIYSGDYSKARGELFRLMSELSMGHKSALTKVMEYLPDIENYVKNLNDEKEQDPDLFIEALIFFLDKAYERSASEAYFIDEQHPSVAVQDSPIDVKTEYDNDFFSIMNNSGIEEILQKTNETYDVSTKTIRFQVMRPFTPHTPESMAELFTNVILEKSDLETYTQTMKIIFNEGENDFPDLSLSDEKHVKENFLSKILIVAARAVNCAEGINKVGLNSELEYDMYPVNSTFLISDFLSEVSPEEDLWVLHALKPFMISYNLQHVQNILKSSESPTFSIDDMVFLRGYCETLLSTLMEQNITPDDLENILSESEIKAERSENTMTMITEMYAGFYNFLYTQADNGQRQENEEVQITVNKNFIGEVVVEFIDNLLTEALISESELEGLDKDNPEFVEHFMSEFAYQASYIFPVIADYIALRSFGFNKKHIGDEKWQSIRNDFFEKIAF